MEIPVYRDEAEARAAVEAAQDQAATQGKRVAVVFGADWCPDSHALDAAFEHRLVEPIVEPAFAVVKVDVGNRDRNLDLMAGYGMQVHRGIPAVAILEPDGSLVTAQTDGEFRNARSLSAAEIASFFHRWARA